MIYGVDEGTLTIHTDETGSTLRSVLFLQVDTFTYRDVMYTVRCQSVEWTNMADIKWKKKLLGW